MGIDAQVLANSTIVPLAVADMNGDGLADVMFGSANSSLSLQLAQADTVSNTVEFTTTAFATNATCIVAVDLDGDGDSDVLVSSAIGVQWLESDGVGQSFLPHTIYSGAGALTVDPADVDGNGLVDVVVNFRTRFVVFLASVSATADAPVTFVQANSVSTGSLSMSDMIWRDMDGDGDSDGVALVVATTVLNTFINTACPPGQYSTAGTGSAPCAPCPLSTFGAVRGLSTIACSGLCPTGQYGDSTGLSACKPCPAGQFGGAPGLTSATCSGACVASPGMLCVAAATSPTGVAVCPVTGPCPLGSYLADATLAVSNSSTDANANATAAAVNASGSAHLCAMCIPCGVGTYYSVDSDAGTTNATSEVSGSESCIMGCMAAAGSYCGAGMSSSTGALCPPGRYTDRVGADSCTPCPAGRYGVDYGMSTSSCTDVCIAPPGSYCADGMSSATMSVVCPRGTYSVGGAVTSCLPCT